MHRWFYQPNTPEISSMLANAGTLASRLKLSARSLSRSASVAGIRERDKCSSVNTFERAIAAISELDWFR